MDFLRHVVLAPGGYLFELWLTMGALMAAPLFASSVVSMPLLLDRRVDVLQAVLTSWQTVLQNPGALAANTRPSMASMAHTSRPSTTLITRPSPPPAAGEDEGN